MLAVRLDPVSVTMTLLVAFIGWVVMRYSRFYLDGEAREGRFHGLMLAALAAVQIVVQSGSCRCFSSAFSLSAYVSGSSCCFTRNVRPPGGPQRSFQSSGMPVTLPFSSLPLCSLPARELWSLATCFKAVGPQLSLAEHLAVGFLVLAAALKAATFPLHGWLTEVMEAPTPVSALLHAGIINAGGFLLIRTADLVQASPGAMGVIVALAD